MKGTLVFDYDGTLNETMRVYEPSFRKGADWLRARGIDAPEVGPERICRWLGMNAMDMWRDYIPDLPEEIVLLVRDVVGDEMMAMEREGKCRWYQGVQDCLTQLKKDGWNMVILSNCRTKHAKGHWEAFEMGRWFTKFYDCQSFGFAPKTEIIKTVMEEQPGPFVMVGDRKHDRDCAKAAGIRFIGCSYGYGAPEELEGADILLNRADELKAAVDRLYP